MPLRSLATEGWSPWRGAIAGLVVGAVLTAVVASTSGDTGHAAGPRFGPEHARQFIDEWRRSQLATWKVQLRWVRETGRGGRLEDIVRIAQRPPDRLFDGAGSVEARRGDRVLACAAGQDGRLRCRDGGAAPDYAADVARGAAVLEQQLIGPDRLYDVARSGARCFQLRLRRSYPAPPYGRRATFCFDGDTAAPTVRDVERPEGRDRQQAVAVSGRVDDSDLAPPPGEPG